MNAVVPFESMPLPAYLQVQSGEANENRELAAPGGQSFDGLSIRGSKFRLSLEGDEQLLVDEATGTPKQTLDIVVVRSNPNFSKAYFGDKTYQDGDDSPPICASASGIAPDDGVESPQAATCKKCPHNVWGSKITEQGKKTRACRDIKRVAIILPEYTGLHPLLLRIPPTSVSDKDNKENELKGWYALAQYGKVLSDRGAKYWAVVTRVAFDPNPSHPKMLFRAVRFLGEDEYEAINALRESKEVATMVGLPQEGEEEPAPEPENIAFVPAQAPAQAPAPAPAQEAKTPQRTATRAQAKAMPQAPAVEHKAQQTLDMPVKAATMESASQQRQEANPSPAATSNLVQVVGSILSGVKKNA